jgi:nucleoside-diphosphate-sugar epimerase
MDVSKLHRQGWRHRITLEEGLRGVYQEYAGKAAVNS